MPSSYLFASVLPREGDYVRVHPRLGGSDLNAVEFGDFEDRLICMLFESCDASAAVFAETLFLQATVGLCDPASYSFSAELISHDFLLPNN
jgi:hypothetical protein